MNSGKRTDFRIMPRPKTQRCTTPGCKNAARTRGKCHNHYQRLRNAVAAGRWTWEQLEAAGEILPAARSGRGDDYLASVEARLAQHDRLSPAASR